MVVDDKTVYVRSNLARYDSGTTDDKTVYVRPNANREVSFTTYQKVVTIDAILLETFTKNVSIDALLQEQANTKLVSIDAFLQKTFSKNVSIDAKLGANQKLVTIDAVLQDTITKDVSIDAKLQGTQTKNVSIDALVGSYKLSSTLFGRTKDFAGADLGFCDMAVFKQNGASPPAYTYQGNMQSDVNGDYEITVADGDALYMIQAIEKSGTPRMDCTDNTLQPQIG